MKAKRHVPVATLVRAWADILQCDAFTTSLAASSSLQRRVAQGRRGWWRKFCFAIFRVQLTAFLMEQLVQPALSSILKGLGPMNYRVPLILVPLQPRQMILAAVGIHLHLISDPWDSNKSVAVPVTALAEFMDVSRIREFWDRSSQPTLLRA